MLRFIGSTGGGELNLYRWDRHPFPFFVPDIYPGWSNNLWLQYGNKPQKYYAYFIRYLTLFIFISNIEQPIYSADQNTGRTGCFLKFHCFTTYYFIFSFRVSRFEEVMGLWLCDDFHHIYKHLFVNLTSSLTFCSRSL